MNASDEPKWLQDHRESRPYVGRGELINARIAVERAGELMNETPVDPLVHAAQTAFNNHDKNTGEHVSPFDTGLVQIGVDGIEVRLTQGVDMDSFSQTIMRAKRATIGWPLPKGEGPMSDRILVAEEDWQEMFRGGLQAALESQTVVFEVWGASRVLTHQLVRSRRAGFHQQSQRSTWYGDRPEVRMPETVWRADPAVRRSWFYAYEAAWAAYSDACDAGVPYEDARYILPEGTVNYIQCEYTIREFIAVYNYRGCSMFLREMVAVMRKMRAALLEQCPELEPFIKVSCEAGSGCQACRGTGQTQDDMPGFAGHYGEKCPVCQGTGGRKCTFQGWENVELACERPQAKESNRVFVATPRLRIRAKS